MENIAAGRAAEALLAEHKANSRFRTLGPQDAPATISDAYDIQDRYVALLHREHGATVGYKVGLTSATMQAFCGIDHPIAGVNVSIPMVTKGGLDAITRSLAMEYAKQGIRFNAVAPGIVNTPMHDNDPKDFLKTLCPMGVISEVSDIVDAIVYLTEARHVTGEVMHVDGGAHNGKW